MNAYLTRLGIRSEIQEWLAPYYVINDAGHLCFDYGDDAETYALAFHRIPARGCWQAGTQNILVRQTILCSSAMEAIAWLNYHPVHLEYIRLIATRSFNKLPKTRCTLVFGNDLLGHAYDLKAASALAGQPVSLSVEQDAVHIIFRFRHYHLAAVIFSLNAFERLSGYRFNHIRTSKPSRHSSWLNQLLNHGND
jgi:hypothetical protein